MKLKNIEDVVYMIKYVEELEKEYLENGGKINDYAYVDYSNRKTNQNGDLGEKLFIDMMSKGNYAKEIMLIADRVIAGRSMGIDVVVKTKSDKYRTFDVKRTDTIHGWGNLSIELEDDAETGHAGWLYEAQVDFFAFIDSYTDNTYVVGKDDLIEFVEYHYDDYRRMKYHDRKQNKFRSLIYISLEDLCNEYKVIALNKDGKKI